MGKKPAGVHFALGRRIRKRRQSMSMTLQELSNVCGVSVSYISQVERDNAVPTLGTLAEIAAALDVSIDHFIATPRQSDSVTRAGERQRFSVSGTSVVYEQIGAEFPGHELTSFVLSLYSAPRCLDRSAVRRCYRRARRGERRACQMIRQPFSISTGRKK
jgi:transcriptional regulator with XRE-family HTH domain